MMEPEIGYTERKEAEAVYNHTSYQSAILAGIQLMPTVYQGTVPAHVKARRRAANKVARASRRRNRG